MKEIRSLGNKINYLLKEKNIKIKELASVLHQPIEDVYMGLAGRKFFSYEQLELIADKLQVNVDELFKEAPRDDCIYSMDCMNDFSESDNQEKIMDIIYDFLDVYDSVNS